MVALQVVPLKQAGPQPMSELVVVTANSAHEAFTQAPQVQLELHVETPRTQPCAVDPQFWVAVGEQTPSPPQAPNAPQVQEELQVRVCVPQLPQACVLVLLGAHVPWPVHVPYAPQVQEELQVRVCVPQFPQACVLVAFGAQAP